MIFKRLMPLVIVFFVAVGCTFLEFVVSNDLMPYDLTGTAIELNATQQAESGNATVDNFSLTATHIIFEATSGTYPVIVTQQIQTRDAGLTSTAQYWATEGITPTIDPFFLPLTQYIIDSTQTAIQFITEKADQPVWDGTVTPTP